MTAILGDVSLASPPASPFFQVKGEGGVYSVLVFEPGWYRVITNEFGVVADRDAPVGPAATGRDRLRAAQSTPALVTPALGGPPPIAAPGAAPVTASPGAAPVTASASGAPAAPSVGGAPFIAPPGVVVVAADGPAELGRPDGHVAWVEAMGAEALKRWCGPGFNV